MLAVCRYASSMSRSVVSNANMCALKVMGGNIIMYGCGWKHMYGYGLVFTGYICLDVYCVCYINFVQRFDPRDKHFTSFLYCYRFSVM